MSQKTIILYEPVNKVIVDVMMKAKSKFPEGQYAIFRKWIKYASNGKIKTEYTDSGYGRLSFRIVSDGDPKPFKIGIGLMWEKLRSALSYNILKDFDIENCHPCILEQVMVKNGLDTPFMEIYNKQRSEFIHKHGKQLKYTVLAWINGGSFESPDNTNPFWKSLYDEINTNMTTLISDKIDQSLRGAAKYKQIRSQKALFGQELEKQMLLHIYGFCQENGIEVASLIYDGLLVYQTSVYDDLCSDVEKYILEKTGFKITFVEKDIQYSSDEWIDSNIITDDLDGAKKIRALLGDRIKKVNGELCLQVNNKWSFNESDVKIEIMEAGFEKLNSKGEPKPYSSNVDGCSKLFKTLTDLVPNDDQFLNELNHQTLNKVFYKNGYYDLKRGKFIEDTSTPTIIRIDRDYKDHNYDWEHPQVVQFKERVLNIFGNEDEIYFTLNAISRAIGGNISDKLFYITTGSRNSGKGILFKILQKTFQQYVTNIPPVVAKTGSVDIAKSNSWILSTNCHIRRIAISNELTTDSKSKPKFDGNALKIFCSGGDAIVARQNYKDEVQVVNNCTVFMAMNSIPSADPPDAMKTCRFIPLPYSFEETVDPSFPCSKKADSSLKDWISNTNWIEHVFEWMVFNAYSSDINTNIPIACIEYTEAVIGDEVRDEYGLFNRFMIKKSTGHARCSDVHDLFKKHLDLSAQKAGIWMKKQGFEQKKIKSENANCYTGVQLKPVDGEFECQLDD